MISQQNVLYCTASYVRHQIDEMQMSNQVTPNGLTALEKFTRNIDQQESRLLKSSVHLLHGLKIEIIVGNSWLHWRNVVASKISSKRKLLKCTQIKTQQITQKVINMWIYSASKQKNEKAEKTMNLKMRQQILVMSEFHNWKHISKMKTLAEKQMSRTCLRLLN